MAKYFLHVFLNGRQGGNKVPHCNDEISVSEIKGIEFIDGGLITTCIDNQKYFWEFAPGNRFYILMNDGQCQEPNGNIVWRWDEVSQDGKRKIM